MFSKIKLFLGESMRELSRVNWPSRQETVRLTIIVIGMSFCLAALLGVFDYLFTELASKYII